VYPVSYIKPGLASHNKGALRTRNYVVGARLHPASLSSLRPWKKPSALAIATLIEDVEIAAKRCSEAKSDFVVFMENGLSIDRPPSVPALLLKTDLKHMVRMVNRGVISHHN
jgi:hypothetical protein